MINLLQKGKSASFSNESEADEWLTVIREMLCGDEDGSVVESLLLGEYALTAHGIVGEW